MSPWLLGIVSAIYFYVAGDFISTQRYAMAMVFGAYAVSNIGLIWESLQ